MWFRFVSYLKFLAKSTNQHGVHSPFVFSYVTQCLYSKKRLHKNKSINLLLKTISYFNFDGVSVHNKSIRELVKQNFPEVQFDKNTVDLLFINELSASSFEKILSEGKLHNDSLILIDSIYANQQNLEQWNQLIALPEVTVSIDMYYCGLISIRREQVKEHFRIRI
ncbi:hypothetical protein J4E06_00575 [Muricauda sp. NFXS6]|uniref:hypothetical protein n=1 Tax=Allomuricauda sp. NFXS6 TaxID=2819094 RepID=UPI0032DFFFCB|tara:strand:+ start:641 stop:1138 length:498 start_codon:yes stop_codon:yes gene_type:complete